MHVVPQAEIRTASSSGTRHQPNSSTIREVVPPTGQRNNIQVDMGTWTVKERVGEGTMTWQAALGHTEAHDQVV